MKINCANKRCNRIKSRHSWGNRRAKECVGDVPREEGALNTHINPREREITESNAPFLFALVRMGLGNKPVDAITFP
jgi:hypothetical protein